MRPVVERAKVESSRSPWSNLRLALERIGNQPIEIRARQLANYVLTAAFGRQLELIHVVEYPKCGGSWVRNMLQTYTGTERFLDQRLLRRGDIVQVHQLPHRLLRRPVVVTRDPRDMYVSFYYHETQYRDREKHLAIARYFQHDPSRPLKEDFAVYLEARLTHVTHPPFPLGAFVRAWQSRPGAVWARYDRFLEDGEAELARVVKELGLPLDPARIRDAVESNSFAAATRARGKERKPGEADPGSFERKGVVGDWKNHFDRRSCELVERHEGASLRALGYERDGNWVERFLKA